MEPTALLLSRQQPGQIVGVSAAANRDSSIVITSADGYVCYRDQVQVDSQTLGAPSGSLALPVQLAGGRYVAVAQLGRSTSLQVLSATVQQQPKRPLAESGGQLPLKSSVLGVHRLASGSTEAAVLVLADGTVGLLQSSDAGLQLQPVCSSTAAAADASSIRTAACGNLVAIASQSAAGRAVMLDVFTMSSSGQVQLAPAASLQLPCSDSKAQLASISIYGGQVALTWSNSQASLLTVALHGSQDQQQQQPLANTTLHLSHHLPCCSSSSTKAGHKRSASKAAAGAAPALGGSSSSGPNTAQCLLLSEQHVLVWAVDATPSSSSSSSSGGAVRFQYALLDSQHCCPLASAAVPLEITPADAAAGPVQCISLNSTTGSSSAELAVLAGAAVHVLQVQLPRADLAGLIGRLAVGSATPAPAAAAPPAADCGLLQVEQVLHECTLLQQSLSGALTEGAAGGSLCWLRPVDPAAAREPAAAAGLHALQAAAQKAADALAAAAASGHPPQQKDKQLAAAVKALIGQLQEGQRERQELIKQHKQQQQQKQATQQQQQSRAGREVEGSTAAKDGSSKQHRAGKKQHAEAQEQPQQQQQQLAPLSHPTKFNLSEQLLGQLATALAEQQQFGLLEQLAALQPLPTLQYAPQLLSLLVQHHQYQLLVQVCSHVQHVDAAVLVAALQALLSKQTGSDASTKQQQYWDGLYRTAEQQIGELDAAAGAALEAGKPYVAADLLSLAKHTAAAVEGFSPRQVCCHCLLAADVDAVELQAALRGLGPQQLLRLVRYLARWAEVYMASGVYAEGKQAGASRMLLQPREAAACRTRLQLITPSWSRVLEWCQVVIDAQLTPLALMPAASSKLATVAGLLQQVVAGTGRLLPLKGLLEHLSAGAPLPQAAVAASARYTVELLDLRVA